MRAPPFSRGARAYIETERERERASSVHVRSNRMLFFAPRPARAESIVGQLGFQSKTEAAPASGPDERKRMESELASLTRFASCALDVSLLAVPARN